MGWLAIPTVRTNRDYPRFLRREQSKRRFKTKLSCTDDLWSVPDLPRAGILGDRSLALSPSKRAKHPNSIQSPNGEQPSRLSRGRDPRGNKSDPLERNLEPKKSPHKRALCTWLGFSSSAWRTERLCVPCAGRLSCARLHVHRESQSLPYAALHEMSRRTAAALG